MAAIVGWPLLWAVWLNVDAPLEAEAQVRKLGEELKVEKDVQLSTTLLASGLTDKVEELNNILENVLCHFVKLGGGPVTKPD